MEMKSFAMSQLEVIIKAAKIEIDVLQKQIAINEGLIEELSVGALKNNLRQEMEKLELAYNDFNAVDSQI